MLLEGKSVVITGAGRGLGRAGALLFAREGASVVVSDVDARSTAMTVSEIEDRGGRAVGVPADVGVEDEVAALIRAAVDSFGKLDVLWNNAGISLPGAPETPFDAYPTEVWERLVRVNLTGVYFGCKYALAPMRRGGGGSIINTSSGVGVAAVKGWAIYSTLKGAINSMTRVLAVELGDANIRVNALAPAGGMSPSFLQGPGGRPVDDEAWQAKAAEEWVPGALAHVPLEMARPPRLDDHANVALFMASDQSAYMTGQIIVVDGGRTAQMMPYASVSTNRRDS
jgi:NAD(P)-dependent dehydrogenase (short-subunit alcohol dehydrogenase family)